MCVKKLFCVSAILFFIASCKVGEDDPWISFRSRDKRLIGYWDFGYILEDSSVFHLKWDIRNDGTIYRKNYTDSFILTAHWGWVESTDNIKRKEVFVVEDINHNGYQFKILRLTDKEIKVQYSMNNLNKTFNTYFNRIEK